MLHAALTALQKIMVTMDEARGLQYCGVVINEICPGPVKVKKIRERYPSRIS